MADTTRAVAQMKADCAAVCALDAAIRKSESHALRDLPVDPELRRVYAMWKDARPKPEDRDGK